MEIKIRITNLSDKEITIKFEPIGSHCFLFQNNEILIELKKKDEGLAVDLIIDDNLNSIKWVENNHIFVDRIDA